MDTPAVTRPSQVSTTHSSKPLSLELKHHGGHRPSTSRRDSTTSCSSENSTASRRSQRPPAKPSAASKQRAPVVVPPHAGQVTTDAYVPAVQPGLRVALVLMRLLQLGACGVSMYANHLGLEGLKMMRAMGMPRPGGVLALGGPTIAMTIINAMLSLLWMWLAVFPQHRPRAFCCAFCSRLPPYISDIAWDALLVCWWGAVFVALLLAHVPVAVPIIACGMLSGLHLITAALSGRACVVQLAADRKAQGVTASVSVGSSRYRVPGMV